MNKSEKGQSMQVSQNNAQAQRPNKQHKKKRNNKKRQRQREGNLQRQATDHRPRIMSDGGDPQQIDGVTNQSVQETLKQGLLHDNKEERGESSSMQAEEKVSEHESKHNDMQDNLKSHDTERSAVPSQKPVFDEVQQTLQITQDGIKVGMSVLDEDEMRKSTTTQITVQHSQLLRKAYPANSHGVGLHEEPRQASANFHESASRIGGSDSDRTLPSVVGIRHSTNTETQVNSSTNLFNQSKSKIEDSGHQCVGEGLDERIDQEHQLLPHHYDHQLDELDKKFPCQDTDRRGNNKIHIHVEEFKESYQDIERPLLPEQKNKLQKTAKIRAINVEYRDRICSQPSPSKPFNSHYHSEHNIDTIIQDEQLVPQYFKSAVYTDEIESKNENEKQNEDLEDSNDDFGLIAAQKNQPRRSSMTNEKHRPNAAQRNEKLPTHLSSHLSLNGNEPKMKEEYRRASQDHDRVIDYAIENPIAPKAHNSCMDIPENGHNFHLDVDYNGNSLQNLNLNKYRYDDYQTSNCSQYLKNHLMQRQNQIKLNLRDISNSENEESQEMEIGHAVLQTPTQMEEDPMSQEDQYRWLQVTDRHVQQTREQIIMKHRGSDTQLRIQDDERPECEGDEDRQSSEAKVVFGPEGQHRKASLFTNSSLKSNKFDVNEIQSQSFSSSQNEVNDRQIPSSHPIHRDFCDMDEGAEAEMDSQALNRAQSEIISCSDKKEENGNAIEESADQQQVMTLKIQDIKTRQRKYQSSEIIKQNSSVHRSESCEALTKQKNRISFHAELDIANNSQYFSSRNQEFQIQERGDQHPSQQHLKTDDNAINNLNLNESFKDPIINFYPSQQISEDKPEPSHPLWDEENQIKDTNKPSMGIQHQIKSSPIEQSKSKSPSQSEDFSGIMMFEENHDQFKIKPRFKKHSQDRTDLDNQNSLVEANSNSDDGIADFDIDRVDKQTVFENHQNQQLLIQQQISPSRMRTGQRNRDIVEKNSCFTDGCRVEKIGTIRCFTTGKTSLNNGDNHEAKKARFHQDPSIIKCEFARSSMRNLQVDQINNQSHQDLDIMNQSESNNTQTFGTRAGMRTQSEIINQNCYHMNEVNEVGGQGGNYQQNFQNTFISQAQERDSDEGDMVNLMNLDEEQEENHKNENFAVELTVAIAGCSDKFQRRNCQPESKKAFSQGQDREYSRECVYKFYENRKRNDKKSSNKGHGPFQNNCPGQGDCCDNQSMHRQQWSIHDDEMNRSLKDTVQDENEDQELANLTNQIKDLDTNNVNNVAAQSLFSKPVQTPARQIKPSFIQINQIQTNQENKQNNSNGLTLENLLCNTNEREEEKQQHLNNQNSTITMDDEIKEDIKVELESNESEIGQNIYSKHSSVIFQQSQDDHDQRQMRFILCSKENENFQEQQQREQREKQEQDLQQNQINTQSKHQLKNRYSNNNPSGDGLKPFQVPHTTTKGSGASLLEVDKVENASGDKSSYSRSFSRRSQRGKKAGVNFSYFAASSLSDDRWLCPICLDIYVDAVETPCCHNLFCERCILRTTQCPLCNLAIVGQLRPNIPIRRLVNELSITCPNEGCSQITKIAEIEKHIMDCGYSLVSCPISDLCGKVMRKNLQEHQLHECPYRIVDCILQCGLMIPLNAMDEHIMNNCIKFEVQCKNNCGQSVQRGRMLQHIEQSCPLEIVECPNKGESLFEEGCTIKLKRREVESHKITCNFRKVHCQNNGCQASIIYKDLQAHDQRCLWKVIDCDNKCGQKIQRQNHERHRQICEFQLVKCPYYDLGCKIEILRKDYKNHLNEESFNHSIIFIEGQKKKNKEIDELKSEISNLRKDYDVEIKTMFLELNRVKSYIAAQKKAAAPDANGMNQMKQSFGQSERYDVNPASSSNFGNHQQFNKQTNFARRVEIGSAVHMQSSDKRPGDANNKFIPGDPSSRRISGDSLQIERPKEAYCLLRNNFLLNDMQPSSNVPKVQCHGGRKQFPEQQVNFNQRNYKEPSPTSFFDMQQQNPNQKKNDSCEIADKKSQSRHEASINNSGLFEFDQFSESNRVDCENRDAAAELQTCERRQGNAQVMDSQHDHGNRLHMQRQGTAAMHGGGLGQQQHLSMASASASTVLLKSGHFYEEHVKDSKRATFKNQSSIMSKPKNFGNYGSNFAPAADMDKHEFPQPQLFHQKSNDRKADHDQMRKSFNNYDAVKNEEQNAQLKQSSKMLTEGQLGKRQATHQQQRFGINKHSQEFHAIFNGSKFSNQQPSGSNSGQQILRQGGLSSSTQFIFRQPAVDGQLPCQSKYQMSNIGQMHLMGANKSSAMPVVETSTLTTGVKSNKHQVFRGAGNNKDLSEDHGKNPLTSFHVSVEKNTEKFQNINCDSCNNSSSQPLRRQFLAVRDPDDKFSEVDHDRQSNSGQPDNPDSNLGGFLGHHQHQLRIGKLKAAQGLPK